MLERDEYEDNLLGDPNQLDDLIEGIDVGNSGNEAENVAEEERNDEGSGDERRKKKTVKRVLNPQPKLDANRLTGPRGIVEVEALFKDFEFHGAGFEDRDLNRILKKLELWGNRLFPKLQFDDFLEKVEKLGHKRSVLSFMNKLRMGLVDEESVSDNYKENLNEMDVDGENNGNDDDIFEQLLSDQQTQSNRSFQPLQITHSPAETIITITEEQRERMMQNQKLAVERRLARKKAQLEQNAGNTSAATIAPVAELDVGPTMELKNIQQTHSERFESDLCCLEPSSGEREEELESEMAVELLGETDSTVRAFDGEQDRNKFEVGNMEDGNNCVSVKVREEMVGVE